MRKERLEEIKKELELDWSDISYVVNQDDVKWLINRVEELEKINYDLKSLYIHLEKTTERYKQALEFYADESNYKLYSHFENIDSSVHRVDEDYGEKERQALGLEEGK